MNKYVYAPAGSEKLRKDFILKCIEFIGSLQTGVGSDFAKGKRYLRGKIHGCSGMAISRAAKVRYKVYNHDYENYGFQVYYYHVDMTADIIRETIEFIDRFSNAEKIGLFGVLFNRNNYIDLIYHHRITQLRWVDDHDYQGQATEARQILTDLERISR